MNMEGHSTVNIQKAIDEGLVFRPLEETVRDTYEWAAKRPSDHEWQNGLRSRTRAKSILTEWKNHL